MPSFRRSHSSLGLIGFLICSSLSAIVFGQQEEIRVIRGAPAVPVPRDVMPHEASPSGTAVVEGVVVSADLGRPVRRATVRLSSVVPRPPHTTVSDDAGRFRFDGGRFFDKPVPLGELRTDEAGRLLVLGGLGQSAPRLPGMRATTFANNEGWHDDISDGPVEAALESGRK